MSEKELSKAYEAAKVEDEIYRRWEASGFFTPENLPDAQKRQPFVVAMPPPNVTGILHLGHALENSILDIAIRYQRMRGRRALLIPGTDHAAVATQARVEGELKKQGLANPRQELGREKLLAKIREYADQSQKVILGQIKKMGTSCDWTRLSYTFDEKRSAAVNELFRRLYQDGLIYRGYRVVNWSVKGQSTCSDDELVYQDQKTKVYTFKYSADFPIPIATTRPETKLGDTAVAVHPDDDRYQKYIGQKFTVDVGAKAPLTITIIADDQVDPQYGTGAVGVTPAHSQIDFEMYLKNKDIGLIPVIGPDGRMTENAGLNYQGLTTCEAREKFVDWLKANHLFIAEVEIDNSVGTSDRFGDIVEALPMEQWFVEVNKKIPGRKKSLKELMREAVTSGHGGNKKKKIIITPERFGDSYLHWIDNLRDWCISRQIWWGHRIPIWYCDTCGEIFYSADRPVQCPKCQSDKLHQDEDTLDTWFSSGAWTFSTLGWPEKTSDLAQYHPTDWMQMGYEILFFWLARMILMTTYALDDIPFKSVYIHGILRDKNGKKFSKSLGNGLDPLEIISGYGADALRLSLIRGVTPGNDARFYLEKVTGARNFVNKLWNISRYILQAVSEVKMIDREPSGRTLAEHWVLGRLKQTALAVNQDLAQSDFSLAAEKLQEFTWNDLADWYIEVSKADTDTNDEILLYLLQNVLRLWHPFIPFVTEEIWSQLGNSSMLIVSTYPEGRVDKKFAAVEADFSLLQEIITTIRNLRAESKIEPAKLIKAIIVSPDKNALIAGQAEIIKKLARLEELTVVKKPSEAALTADIIKAVVVGAEIYLDLSGIIDKAAQQERRDKEIAQSEKYITTLEAKLANQDFMRHAPPAVVAQEKQKLAEQKERLDKLKAEKI